jgi:ATP-dependent DNA helicase RecQ
MIFKAPRPSETNPEVVRYGVRTLHDEAEQILRTLVGPDAQFRDGQWRAIEALVVERRRVLCVQRTGWGKSAVYFIATSLLRARGAGPTLIISPLLALMFNQIDAASRAGIAARTINSANIADWNDVYDEVLDGTIDLLLVSPERLNHPDFRDYILPTLAQVTGLVVVDEAHCISDWGHDFRPDYRRIRTLLVGLAPGVPVLATTATANARVVADVVEQLGDALVLRGSSNRESLHLEVAALPTAAHRLAWLACNLANFPGSGIIYTLTVNAAHDTAAFLRSRGHAVAAYSAQLEDAERRAAELDLLKNDVKALVATSALGMGFDKPDLAFVIHLGAPPSPITYYQQIGRAGRSLESARAVLLPGAEDSAIWRYFSMLSIPPEEQVRRILDALSTAGRPLSTQVLETHVDLSRTHLEHVLKILDVDGAVRRVEGGWISTSASWHHDAERYARVSTARTIEQDNMLQYIALPSCRMAFLRRCLDDLDGTPCGKCDQCTGLVLSHDVPADLSEAARGHYHRVGLEISSRVRWPTGLPAIGILLSGNIRTDERALPGRVIGRLSDIGRGEALRQILDEDVPDGSVPRDLLESAVRVIEDWSSAATVRPRGIVAIQSTRRARLVSSLAEGIAQATELPFLGTLATASNSANSSSNGAHRIRALQGAFAVSRRIAEACRELDGPVLLVDAVVDSGWTMTLAARELRRAGARGVLPFALAATDRTP